ncbi:MAG: anti-sigma factor, partial [Acidobacteriota bacterium]
DYHLWFMTQDGPVDAGVVEVDGGIAGLRDLNMPDDTSGFRLTLEPSNTGDQPSGDVILVGESPVSL